jgi:putative component of membrane protein insertase Oxa1/YidC/SpoIIIJ protein YidD
MKTIFTIILFLLLYRSNSALGQSIIPNEFSGTFYKSPEKPHWEFTENNSNELQLIFSGLFLFYKFAISSQDSNKCSFHPSCSEYGLLAVKKHGTIFGMLATLDRLQRCNGLSPELYEVDQQKMILIDHPLHETDFLNINKLFGIPSNWVQPKPV